MPRLSSKGNVRRRLSQTPRRSIRLYSLTLLVIFTLGFVSFTVRTHAQDGAPANDNFANAQSIGETPSGNTSGSNVGATLEEREPSAENYSSGGASIWYKWTAPATGKFSFDTFTTQDAVDNDGFVSDTQLAIYSGTSINDLTEQGSSEDAGGSDEGYQSRVTFNATQGTVYYISLDSYSGQDKAGNIALNWRQVQSVQHDDFADAKDLGSEGQGSVSGFNNADASAEAGEPEHSGYVSNSLWFKWTAPSDAAADASISFNTYGSDFDTVMAVYVGTSVNELSEITSNDEGDNETNGESQVDFPITAGTTYHIAVDGYDGDTGNIVLNWGAAAPVVRPANDNFTAAEELIGTSGTVAGNNRNATGEAGEPTHGASEYSEGRKSVWYKFTPTENGTVAFDTLQTGCDSDACLNTVLAVYTGASVDALTLVTQNDDADRDFVSGNNSTKSRVFFDARVGTTYYIAVDESFGGEGDITLHYEPFTVPVPANDNFADAQNLTTASGSFEATNKYASAESGEPQHVNEPAVASVWYRYTATTTGGVFFKASSAVAQNSFFSPRIAVYTGDNLGTLTAVKSSAANAGSGFSGTATVGFQAVAGTTYYIAVDGQKNPPNGGSYSNSSGRFIFTYGNDTTAPTTNATASAPTTTGYYRGLAVGVNIQANDGTNGSGVRSITYTVTTNGTAAAPVTVNSTFAQAVIRTEGTSDVAYFATDNAGNVSETKTFTIKIDRTAPTTSASANGAAIGTGFTRATSVTLNAVDNFEVASITYSVNGGAAQTVSGASASVPVGEGTTTITYFATDKATNAEATKTVTVKVDRTAPSATTARPNSTANSSGYYNGANGAVKITLSATDATSGIAGYNVRVGSAPAQFVPASNPVVTLSDGTTTLTYSAVDNAGNAGASSSSTYKVDATAPVTSYTVSSQGRNITLTVNFRDNLSGYIALNTSVNGGQVYTTRFNSPQTNGTYSYTFNGPYNERGTYTIRYFGTDVAGNNEAAKEVTFTIPPQAITPFASTPVRNANGTYTVTFGYQNDNQVAFNIAVGSSNFFSPNPQNRNQTTTFQPGRVANAFSVTWNGSRLTWTIKSPDGQTRSVSVR